MISALAWVKSGVAKQIPERYQPTEEEIAQLTGHIEEEVQDAKEQVESAQVDPELAEYDLENYDNDSGESGIPVFRNLPGLAYHDGDEDPYVAFKDEQDEDEELKEMEILPTDKLLLACKTEEELSHLEVLVYEQEEDNLYVHHDIMLPSFPLCAEWMDLRKDTQDSGNMVAIGTFDPEIEIWNLDMVDVMYPHTILGSTEKKKKSRKNRTTTIQPDRHISAVTSLSWNKSHRNLLLSGSADTTIKLWDLNSSKAVRSYDHHTDKVVAVQWNPVETTVFLSGGYDEGGRVCALDSRNPKQVSSWKLGSDVECIRWDPHHPERFFVSTENGLVKCFDARNASDSLFTIHAHDGAVSSMDVNPHIQGLLVTGSSDKMVKVWDIRDGQQKNCITSRDLGVGKVFATSFCLDSDFVLASAGSKGKIVLWNLHDNPGVRRTFGSSSSNTEAIKSSENESKTTTEIVTIMSDDEPESDDEANDQEALDDIEEEDDDMEEGQDDESMDEAEQ